jgi:signal transduction histidine kinase
MTAATASTRSDRPSNAPDQTLARWIAVLEVLTFPLFIALFVLGVVGIALIPISAGLLLLAVALPATRALADLYRRLAGRLLGTEILSPYRAPTGATVAGRLLQRLRDPQTWRDLAWLIVSATVGFVIAIFSLTVLAGIAWYAIFPFLFWVAPAGVFDTNYGIFHVERLRDSVASWVFVPIAFALWWWVVPVLSRSRARIDRALLGPTESARVRLLESRVSQLSESRSDTIDVQAAELRRIERDLHDGAQARLVASGMTLGMAIETLEHDPVAAKALLQEARATNRDALVDLRSVVRGLHPPVLSDRGLVGAVQALAVQMPTATHVVATLSGRPPAAVESAAYFAIAECLANVGKHAGATRIVITLGHERGRLSIDVEDDGKGGARLDPNGGLAGVARRLAAFDGTLDIDSPSGGPTRVAMMVPCELSSPKT